MTSLYDFSILNQDNQTTPLDAYRGKVLLVVNTATGCGFNAPVSRTPRTL